MTPTTAEQMPQPNWELVLQCVQIKANACISPELASLYTEQHAALTSWLAQGGARGVLDRPARVSGRDFFKGEPTQRVIGRAHAEYDRYHYTALAPRVETGEAVLTNPHTGTPRDYRDVESDPEGILIAVPGEPLRPYKPTAACGVSGLVGKWRDAGRFCADAGDPSAAQAFADCAYQLEAALKANRGAASDAMVEAAQAAYTDAFADGNTHRHSWRTALTAALSAGALAVGEVVAHEMLFKHMADDGWEWVRCSEAVYRDVQSRPELYPNIAVRSLVVGGVGR